MKTIISGETKKITLGIPKGSLQENTIQFFKEAGFDIEVPERGYFLEINDSEIDCFLLRPQEIPKYIERGKLDLGVSGDDWIAESQAKVIKVCDLKYAKQEIRKIKWVLAVSENSGIKSVKDLEGKIISTEIVNLVKNYLKKNKVRARVEFSWGTTEVKPPRFADAIVDLVETGTSFRMHNLRAIDTILTSSTKLIANKDAFKDKWKREKIREISLLLQGALRGKENVILIMHVPGEKLKKILKMFPRFKSPSVRKITGQNWYEVEICCREKENRELIPKLKRMGAEGLVEYPLIKLVP